MCGIVGIVSKKDISELLIKKLKMLEYRGYDSAGLSFLKNNNICVIKHVGHISAFKYADKEKFTTGIAHTRWATHGKANIVNCHPHLSQNNIWSVVHNGIIENYKSLKQSCIKSGDTFYSQTDTEVVAKLLENDFKGIDALISACKKLKGSYALVCMNNYEKNSLYFAKKSSPLYVAEVENDLIVASDIICFEKASYYYTLEDNEFGAIKNNEIKFYNIDGNEIIKKKQDFDLKTFGVEKQEEHYMLQEIKQTHLVFNNIFENKNDYQLDFSKFKSVYLIGCGSAYNSALFGKLYLNEFKSIRAECFLSSEFVFEKINLNKSICLFISQSGETADTIKACEFALKKGAFCVGLVNNIESTLARLCNYKLNIRAGMEISVASTKAFSCQVLIMFLLCYKRGNGLWINNLNKIDLSTLEKAAESLVNCERAFFLGKGIDYLISIESCLKLKEVSYINCGAYPSGELKHGPLALIEKGDIVFAIITQKQLIDKELNAIHEVKARGARVILLTQFKKLKKHCEADDVFILFNDLSEKYMPFVGIVTFQYLSYFVSTKKGINPDKPKNLAKSVTVE